MDEYKEDAVHVCRCIGGGKFSPLTNQQQVRTNGHGGSRYKGSNGYLKEDFFQYTLCVCTFCF